MKNVNQIETLTDFKTLLESDAGDIARRLDSPDRIYEGAVDI